MGTLPSMSTSSDIAAITAVPHADKLLTEIVRLRRTTKRIAERLDRAVDTSYSSSIDEFCASEGISRGQYYKLRKEGRGPREMRLAGQLVRITPEAKAEWRRAREAETAGATATT